MSRRAHPRVAIGLLRLPGSMGFVLLVLLALMSVWQSTARAEDGFLESDKAFKFGARLADDRHLEISFDIAPGYYMYREQFRFSADKASLGQPKLPQGHVKFDDTFQKEVETYRGRLLIQLPIEQAAGPFRLDVVSQGCSDRGLCYPPAENHADIRLAAGGSSGSVTLLPSTPFMPGGSGSLNLGGAAVTSGAAGGAESALPGSPPSSVGRVNTASPADSSVFGAGVESALQSGRYLSVVGVFLVAGVLLSLTPCVLPMLPILSSIIVGDREDEREDERHGGREGGRDHERDHGRGHAGDPGAARGSEAPLRRGRSFLLALSYSLGMALVYTALGVAAGLVGEGLAAALQKPWVLSVFSIGLVILALSMFGAYELRPPASWTSSVSSAAGRLRGGRLAGVFAMGGLSALIVSPCVAAPLAGALVYISQTRDAWLGGTALFSLALGMSVPLLLIGASAGALLPRAGSWMEGVKRVFGVLLLAVAIWIVQPVIAAPFVLALWGVLLIGSAWALLVRPAAGSARDASSPAASGVGSLSRKTLATVLAIYGLMQLVGAASGGANPLQPLGHLVSSRAGSSHPELKFVAIKTSADLDRVLREAKRPVMLDFYADWCVSCKEMERFTFADPAVQNKLANVLLLQADVTRNSPEDRELLRRFNLFGPPGTLFFDSSGAEQLSARVIGFQSAERFLQTLASAGL